MGGKELNEDHGGSNDGTLRIERRWGRVMEDHLRQRLRDSLLRRVCSILCSTTHAQALGRFHYVGDIPYVVKVRKILQ